MTDQLIALTGFMGAGKTTIGRALAATLGCDFIDLDEVVAANQKKSIEQIIEADGETSFRRWETEALRCVLRDQPSGVIALGGGTWTVAENRELLRKREAHVIWLDVDFELCWKRILSGGPRPLAASRESAEKLARERRGSYQTADEKISIGANAGVDEIVSHIASRWHQKSVPDGNSQCLDEGK